MKGKGERGNSDRGLWGKRKRVGGFWPKGLLPPLACAPVRGRGGALAAAARRPPGHERGRREGEKEEGDEGVLLPHSPWVEAARGDGSTGGGGPVVVVLGGGGALVLRQGEEVTVVRCGGLGSDRPLL
jgi:hypothetical protein